MPNPPADRFPLGARSVRRIEFGAMQLPGPGVFGPPRDRNEAVAVVRRAVDLGVDHIDTAQYYGPAVANELLREALYPYPDELTIVSKVGARRDDTGGWLPAGTPEELRVGVEDNLRTLGVDHLGAVNLRVHDDDRPAGVDGVTFAEQLGTMVELRADGFIGGIGLSNVSKAQFDEGTAFTDIVCVQNPLNVTNRESWPVLEACRARGIAFVPFFPLGSGFPGMNTVLGDGSVVATAARLGATPAQIALAWILAVGENTLLIPGTSSVVHLEENLAAGSATLDDEAVEALGGIGT